MIVWVRHTGSTGYSHGLVIPRTNPTLLVPTTTTFTAIPDRITSNNYATFTSNIILAFKLEGHALTSFWDNGAKI
jgi:hypothetical protein